MYKTRPFEKALQEAFEDRPLFGGLNSQEGHMVKVAVTATTLVGRRPVILANYNRPDGPGYSKSLISGHLFTSHFQQIAVFSSVKISQAWK
jgi:hypothetical protein